MIYYIFCAVKINMKLNRSLFVQGNDVIVQVEACKEIKACPDKKAPFKLPGTCCFGCGGYIYIETIYYYFFIIIITIIMIIY